jgi:hypothetical protein
MCCVCIGIGVNGPKTVIGDGPGHFTDSNRGPTFQPPLTQQPQHPDLTAGYKGRGDSGGKRNKLNKV